MKILLDAMGGDNAPDAAIKGAVRASKEIKSEIVLIGNEEIINAKIKEFYGKDSISEISGGITKGRDLTNVETIELPYLRVANVQNGYLDLSEVKTIKLKVSEKQKYLLQLQHVDGALLAGSVLLHYIVAVLYGADGRGIC